VPPDLFVPFWQTVRAALRPNGRVFFVDSLYDQSSTAIDHELGRPEDVTQTRRLNDGSEYRIVKRFYQPQDLERDLSQHGWHITARATPHYFLYGWGERTSPAQ